MPLCSGRDSLPAASGYISFLAALLPAHLNLQPETGLLFSHVLRWVRFFPPLLFVIDFL